MFNVTSLHLLSALNSLKVSISIYTPAGARGEITDPLQELSMDVCRLDTITFILSNNLLLNHQYTTS
jgi:hypothetical protein